MSKNKRETGQDPIYGRLHELYGDEIYGLSKADLQSLIFSASGPIDGSTNLTMDDVKRCRIANDMSQREFAEMFSIPFATYVQWEAGRRNPPAYVLNLMRSHMNHILREKSCDITYITDGAYLELADGHFDMLRLTILANKGRLIGTKEKPVGSKELKYQKERYKAFSEKLYSQSIYHEGIT